MKKLKKIGGYLVVQFNAREIKEWGSTLGEYGVIDEELYTGNLDIDKGALEFDGIDNLEEAIDQARGLVCPPEPEHIKTGFPAPKTITIIKGDDLVAEHSPLDDVPPEEWRKLSQQIETAVGDGVEKVLFKAITHKAENKKGQLPVTLEFLEFIPQTITATKSSKKSGSSGSPGSSGKTESSLNSNYNAYLESGRGKSSAVDDANSAASLDRVSQMPY